MQIFRGTSDLISPKPQPNKKETEKTVSTEIQLIWQTMKKIA